MSMRWWGLKVRGEIREVKRCKFRMFQTQFDHDGSEGESQIVQVVVKEVKRRKRLPKAFTGRRWERGPHKPVRVF